ncbi:pentapeptide repeat-containing protein, partial [Holdemania filiformis]
MKQIKKEPQAPRLPLALETVVLTSALAAQEKLIGLEINDDLWPEEKALGKEFSECRLTKVTMAAISEKTYFVDVIFDHCDFSNCQLSESTLRRVVFDHCRMTGADLSRCVLQDVVFLNCALDYSNFAFSSFKSCRFADCICTQSSFSEGKFTAFEIQRCKLDESEFFHS